MANSVEVLVAELVHNLADRGFSLSADPIDWNDFARASQTIHSTFNVPATSISPVMRRLLYAIGCSIRGDQLLGIGTYVGYAFAWIWAGAISRQRPTPNAICVDLDEQFTHIAERNFRAAFGDLTPSFLVADAVAAQYLTADSAIDLLYVDLDHPVEGKWPYLDALQSHMTALRTGAIVLAHDAVVPKFADALSAFVALVSPPRFLVPVTLPVDDCGLVFSEYVSTRGRLAP